MGKQCYVTGRKASTGNRSHALNANKRRFNLTFKKLEF